MCSCYPGLSSFCHCVMWDICGGMGTRIKLCCTVLWWQIKHLNINEQRQTKSIDVIAYLVITRLSLKRVEFASACTGAFIFTHYNGWHIYSSQQTLLYKKTNIFILFLRMARWNRADTWFERLLQSHFLLTLLLTAAISDRNRRLEWGGGGAPKWARRCLLRLIK